MITLEGANIDELRLAAFPRARGGRMSRVGGRRTALAAAAVLVAAGVAATGAATPAAAAPPCTEAAAAAFFQGSSGPASVVIGAPHKSVGGRANVGAVEIRHACDTSAPTQVLTGPAGRSALFGFSVAVLDLNGDHYSDLLVGMPLYNLGAAVDAGAVAVYYGSPTGLHLHTILTQASPGIPGAVRAGARFGTAMLAQPSTNPIEIPHNYVRIGEPGRDVGSATDAGGFVDLRYRLDGALDYARQVTFSTPGVPGTPQKGARLGAALSYYGLVGAPGYPVAGHRGAGAVLTTRGLLYIGETWLHEKFTLVTQNTHCVPGRAETGDHFGAAVAGRWIGIPDEDIRRARDAGMVVSWNGGHDCYGLSEDSKRMGGEPATGDHFGAALSEPSHYYEDDLQYTGDYLLIGSPGTDTAHGRDSGRIYWRGEDNNLENDLVSLSSFAGHSAGSAASANAHLGTALAQDTPLVGAPGGDGIVYFLKRSDSGMQTVREYRQAAPVQSGVYGTALAN